MSFQLWSQINKEALKEIKPDFGFRSWNNLSPDDKHKIWKYLELHFFDKESKRQYGHIDGDDAGNYYEFFGEFEEQRTKKKRRIFFSILRLNDLYKAKTYAKDFLENANLYNACRDFYHIFHHEGENVVLELLSLYCKVAANERNEEYFRRVDGELEDAYALRKDKWKWEPFDELAKDVNEVFSHFGLNIHLTRLGIIPQQEEKILEEVYLPTIMALANPQWKEVNQLLADAFKEYRNNTPIGFSNSVTNTVAAVQAFLQILVSQKTGTGDISKLIPQAISKGLIPNDLLSKEIFKNIESILMKERQETGISHPKREYATDKNARMVLNVAMVFLQHCIQKIGSFID